MQTSELIQFLLNYAVVPRLFWLIEIARDAAPQHFAVTEIGPCHTLLHK